MPDLGRACGGLADCWLVIGFKGNTVRLAATVLCRLAGLGGGEGSLYLSTCLLAPGGEYVPSRSVGHVDLLEGAKV